MMCTASECVYISIDGQLCLLTVFKNGQHVCNAILHLEEGIRSVIIVLARLTIHRYITATKSLLYKSSIAIFADFI